MRGEEGDQCNHNAVLLVIDSRTSMQPWRSNQPQRRREAAVASESGAVSETGSTWATARRQQRNDHNTYVLIKGWGSVARQPLHPAGRLLAGHLLGQHPAAKATGSTQSTDCQHDQLSKQLQFGRGDL